MVSGGNSKDKKVYGEHGRCGGKSRGSGKRCRNDALPNGKCRFHGGRSTGPPKGSKNHLAVGIYASGVLPGEEKFIEEAVKKIGTLDDEIVMIRLQLRRALIGQKLWLEARGLVEKRIAEGKFSSDFYDLESVEIDIVKDDKGKAQIKKRMLRKKHDFGDRITRYSRLLAKFELTRVQMIAALSEQGCSVVDLAAELRAFGDAAFGTVPAAPDGGGE